MMYCKQTQNLCRYNLIYSDGWWLLNNTFFSYIHHMILQWIVFVIQAGVSGILISVGFSDFPLVVCLGKLSGSKVA